MEGAAWPGGVAEEGRSDCQPAREMIDRWGKRKWRKGTLRRGRRGETQRFFDQRCKSGGKILYSSFFEVSLRSVRGMMSFRFLSISPKSKSPVLRFPLGLGLGPRVKT